MANPENLIGHGFHERTASEQREIARAGGVASGKARRKKAAAKKAFADVLASVPALNKETLSNLERLGLADLENVDIQTLIAYAIAQKAMKGDVKAANFMMEMTGEDAYSKVQRERTAVAKKHLEYEKRRLEMDERKAAGVDEYESHDDGFIEAMSAAGREVWDDAGDEPQNINDSADDEAGADDE